jgi:hypothetical protein
MAIPASATIMGNTDGVSNFKFGDTKPSDGSSTTKRREFNGSGMDSDREHFRKVPTRSVRN